MGLGRLHDGRWRTPSAAKMQALQTTIEGDIPAPAKRDRLIIDMTATHRFGGHTGVQRVVREIARACVESGAGLAVYMEDGRLYSHFRHSVFPDAIELQEGDRLLLLDSGWGFVEEYPPLLEMAHKVGAETIGCLYDLVPLRYPAATAMKNSAPFIPWFKDVLMHCDAFVCISRSVAEDLVAYMREERLAPPPKMRIGWWPLGADFRAPAQLSPSPIAQQIASAQTPFFMSVGTLEPRKAYSIALDAFEQLWAEGCDARYMIVGRRGWNTRALQRRIREHAEFGRKLFWLDNASDADLAYLYPRARALIFPSFVEGFGMPLVEAAHCGARVIASDIPIFHEVGGEEAVYFDLLDSQSLAARVREALADKKAPCRIPIVSWQASANALARILRDEAYQIDAEAVRFSVAKSSIVGLEP
jgi:alpha-1,2-rhamnosyltransferase